MVIKYNKSLENFTYKKKIPKSFTSNKSTSKQLTTNNRRFLISLGFKLYK